MNESHLDAWGSSTQPPDKLQRLLAPTFLFRFELPCQELAETWPVEEVQLPESCRIPHPAELDGKRPFADVRVGWNPQGLAASVRVQDKRKLPRCSASRPDESEGLHLFVATRSMESIHRANRFCHHFACLPEGAGRTASEPFVGLVTIARSMANPSAVPAGTLKIRGEKRVDGYLLRVWIPAAALTAYDTTEHSRLGFFYVVQDLELGWQTLTLSPEYPIKSDPSLWCELELQRAAN